MRGDVRRMAKMVGVGTSLTLFYLVGVGRAEIIANLELPAAASTAYGTATGISNLQGWAYTTAPGAEIQRLIDVFIDDSFAFNAPCCSSRGDVQAVYPDAPVLTGFSAAYNWQLLVSGNHRIRVVIRSSAGEERVLTRTIETLRPFGVAFVRDVTTHFFGGACTLFGDPLSSSPTAVVGLSNLRFRTSQKFFPCGDGTTVLRWDRATQDFKTIVHCTPGSASEAFLYTSEDLID
jgi:hypothetical protein